MEQRRSDRSGKRRASELAIVGRVMAHGQPIEEVFELGKTLVWDPDEIVRKGRLQSSQTTAALGRHTSALPATDTADSAAKS